MICFLYEKFNGYFFIILFDHFLSIFFFSIYFDYFIGTKGGDVLAVGRGGMRGRRRVNEAECLLTKPSGCVTKQGEYESQVVIFINFNNLIFFIAIKYVLYN